jgi:SpoVK/Ycf46/Vps4 family AAA+-type ATPase
MPTPIAQVTGKPGTGKTSYCILFARRHTNKIIKISNEALFEMEKGDLDLIFNLLGPEFVISDDFDRANYSDAQRVLFFLESMKQDHKNISLLATANSLEEIDVAVLRPGRFDEIISFAPPKSSERREIIKKYCEHFKVNLSEKEIVKLVKISRGYTHAYLKEFVMHIMHDDLESLIKRIKMLKNLQENGDFMTFGQNDIDDDEEEEIIDSSESKDEQVLQRQP